MVRLRSPIPQSLRSLAHESGSQDAEAAAHRTMAELATLRGRLDDALRHAGIAQSQYPSDPVVQVEDLARLSRILALQGDLAGARKNQTAALSLAEKTGAKGQGAQARLALAQLDLEEGRAAEVEQPIRDALSVFISEKMRDDELQAQFVLSRSLLARGKI